MQFSSDLRREREEARRLRKSRWWHNLCARTACRYCGKALSSATATMDHVVPLAEGGRSRPGNIVPACKACNSAKGGRTAATWVLDETTSEGAPGPSNLHSADPLASGAKAT